MTYEEIKQKLQSEPSRKPSSNDEHRLQCACVQWFRIVYPTLAQNLFAVPNGGRRDRITGARLKAEGVTAGVADLILLLPNTQYHALLIEMKTTKGTQQKTQKQWQEHIEKFGYKYIVCRTFEQFRNTIKNYILCQH